MRARPEGIRHRDRGAGTDTLEGISRAAEVNSAYAHQAWAQQQVQGAEQRKQTAA
jgi:hypothetical protein